MRVPPPTSHRLSAQSLLRDVRARLSERLPQLARQEDDPTDPAWLLLEQAAWMVERLSEQLDSYPFAALQQLLHLSGGELLPALPALGVVVVQPEEDGVLRQDPERPDTTRFFTGPTERVGPLEFVPAEGELPLRRAELASICRLEAGRLYTYTVEPLGSGGRPGVARPSSLIQQEELCIHVAGATSQLATEIGSVIEQLRTMGDYAWLHLALEESPTGLVVVARVDLEQLVAAALKPPSKATPETQPDPDRLTLSLAPLPRWQWTPPLELSDAPELPLHRRGTPLESPGAAGRLVLRDLPVVPDPVRLLRRQPAPTPPPILEDIWGLLRDNNDNLANVQAIPTRRLRGAPAPGEPAWALAALQAGLLTEETPLVGVELRLRPGAAGTLRVALVNQAGPTPLLQGVRLLALETDGSVRGLDTPPQLAWSLPLPDRGAEGAWRQVSALDLPVPEETAGLVLLLPERPDAVLLNALLVVQAPAVRDGRQWQVQRHVPEPLSLLHPDLVDSAVVERLCQGVRTPEITQRVQALPLARVQVAGQEPLRDWAGVGLDASGGQVVLNTPDGQGRLRDLRPGLGLTLSWYRRTDGRWGNVPEGSIRQVEQEPQVSPRLGAAVNPLPTCYGRAREAPEEAIERLFGARAPLPVLPSDFEQIALDVLGRDTAGWVARCWTYTERTLFPWALWPLPEEGAAEPGQGDLRAWLREAEPDQVLLALGSRDEQLSAGALDAACREVEQALRERSARVPALRGFRVTRLWLLSAQAPRGVAAPDLPAYGVRTAGVTLRDALGRQGEAPVGVQLLNAAVVRWDGRRR